jgi:hypothetical protein
MIPSDDLSNLFVGAANDRHVSKQLSIDNAVVDQFASTPPAHFPSPWIKPLWPSVGESILWF